MIDVVSAQTGYVAFERPQRRLRLSSAQIAKYGCTLRFLLTAPPEPYMGLFIITDLSRYPVDDDNSFDRLHDSYFNLFEHPLIFKATHTPHPSKPDWHYEHSIFTQTVLSHWAFANAKFVRLTARENQQILDFAHEVSSLYRMPQNEAGLELSMRAHLTRYQALRTFMTRWIIPKMRKPYFAVIENASYLGREGLLTKILHEAGFQIAEVQHGLISPKHYVYNLPPSCLQATEHPSHIYMPDIFFTFGDYWSAFAQIPAEKISIGSPHLARMFRSLPTIPVNVGQILVLSGDVRALELTRELAQAFPHCSIVFKLHPAESHLFDSYSAQLQFSNVRVVGFANVYELIAASEVIVGHSTTTLIEAVAFSNKRIFYHDSEFIPPDVGDQFVEAADLIEMIKNPSRGIPRSDAAKFWTFDVEERLARFAAERLHIQASE